MSTKVSTGFGWLEDDVTGDPAGVRRHSDGKEFTIPFVETDPVTGGNAFIESLVRQLDGIIVGAITRDENGAALSSAVKFPDGVTGVYTALVVSADFPGAVDSYSVTYGDQTYTQPTVTRDVSGVVTNRPSFEVA